MRIKIIPGGIYHVLNRGVDGRSIFNKDQDYLRFIHDLFEFNDEALASNNTHRFLRQNQYKTFGRSYIAPERAPRKFLVELLAFTLMPNHYHLLLKPRAEDGIAKFIQRVNMGYAQYFNLENNRHGTLFQGRYKIIPVESEAHFIHIPYYIHCNPLDLQRDNGNWRERKIKNGRSAIGFLKKYRWSSHLDYCGIKNFPSVTQREHLLQFFGGEKEYEEAFERWLNDFDGMNIRDFALEPIL